MRDLVPFAAFAELDVAHDGLEFVVLRDVVGELVVVEALGRPDRFAQHLEIGIAPAAEIVTERIDAFGRGARLIFFEEIRVPAPSISASGTQIS